MSDGLTRQEEEEEEKEGGGVVGLKSVRLPARARALFLSPEGSLWLFSPRNNELTGLFLGRRTLGYYTTAATRRMEKSNTRCLFTRCVYVVQFRLPPPRCKRSKQVSVQTQCR